MRGLKQIWFLKHGIELDFDCLVTHFFQLFFLSIEIQVALKVYIIHYSQTQLNYNIYGETLHKIWFNVIDHTVCTVQVQCVVYTDVNVVVYDNSALIFSTVNHPVRAERVSYPSSEVRLCVSAVSCMGSGGGGGSMSTRCNDAE